MRFELDADQAAIMSSVGTLLERHAGPARARELGGDAPEYDEALDAALGDAGFSDTFASADGGPLSAALVTEAVARQLGVVGFGAYALVAPALGITDVEGPVGLVVSGSEVTRFAPAARTLLLLERDAVRLIPTTPGFVEPVRARCGYPIGRLGPLPGGEPLATHAATRMRDWWRVSLAVEMVGTMAAALEQTVSYVKEREQFDRPIGSFQAVQHRLAECAVMVHGAQWLALETVWLNAPTEAASAALNSAIRCADRILTDTHQFTGALGFTLEYDLHLWTMRLPALKAEAESLGSPAQALAEARW